MSSELPSLCQEWLDDLARRGRQPTTIAAYRVSMGVGNDSLKNGQILW